MKKFERKYYVDDYFLDYETPEKYWLLGLLASDGSIGKYNQIFLAQSGDEGLKTIEYVKELLSAECPIRHVETGFQVSHSIQVSSNKLLQELEKYNIVRNKTNIYAFPEIPEKYLSSFLAGYVEGDGCITIINNNINNNNYKYLHASFVGTKEFIEKCHEIIPVKSIPHKHHSSSVYEIRWNAEKAVEFCKWIYQEPFLYHGRKYNNFITGKIIFEKSRKERYKRIKEKVLDDMKKGINDYMEYSKKLDIPFQTIYKWRTEWIKQEII